MKAIQEFRRLGIVLKKRISLFKYNAQIKRQVGFYEPNTFQAISQQRSSLNLLDFSTRQDFYLIDAYSDATEYGGESCSNLSQVTENNHTFLRVNAQLKRERSNLMMIDYMFAGFKCLYLTQKSFTYFNGVKITMKPPSLPCKMGFFIKTNINEYEQFVGHLLDNKNNSNQWQQYELPISLMFNDKVQNKLITPHSGDDFVTKGLTFVIENKLETQTPVTFYIAKIDAIYNPEYDKLMNSYKLPVYMKSPHQGQTYSSQGFIDNGRQKIPYGEPKYASDEPINSINNVAYQEDPQMQTKSIKERLNN